MASSGPRATELRRLLASIEVSPSPNMMMVVVVALITGIVLFFAITKLVPSLTDETSKIKVTIPGLVVILVGMGIGGKLAYDYL